jgi:hypothetical protein
MAVPRSVRIPSLASVLARLLGIVLVCLVAAGCGGSSSDGEQQAAGGPLTDLAEIDQLRTAFNEKQGQPRLVVLLSPT